MTVITQKPSGYIGIFAQHPVAANLLMLLMIFSGVWGLAQMNTQFFPSFDIDIISISVARPGASAEDMEQSITIPLEQELRTVDYVKKMTSTSQLGISAIVIEFEEGTDMGLALDQVKERVGLVRNLPADAEEPEITKIENYEPVARLVIAGARDLNELRPMVRQIERELLDRGISKVNFSGLPEEEIAIQISTQALDELGLSLNQVADRIAQISRDVPAGTIGKFESARQIRTIQQARSENDFAKLPLIVGTTGRLIRLGDVATIKRRPKSEETIVYYKGEPAIDIELLRTGDTDALYSAQVLDEWLKDFRPTLPPNIHLHLYNENWMLIVERINLLLKNGAGGLLLIIAILFFFLNGRVAFWVAVGIPVSFMATLAVLFLFGGSINMVSLFGLIMALGIIVDDAIVVSEDALTHYQQGENALKAAEGGAKRMLAPVMSSSLTTISAFLPLMIVSGIIGTIMFAIPLVVICVIIASLVESFLVLPGHLHHSFLRHSRTEVTELRKRLDRGFYDFRNRYFRPIVAFSLRYRWTTMSAAIALFLFSIALLATGRIGFNFFPSPEGTVIFANAQFSAGTSPETVRRFIDHVDDALYIANDNLKTDSDLVHSSVSRLNATFSFDPASGEVGENVGSVFLELVSPDARGVDNKTFIEEWRKHITLPAGIEVFTITPARGGPPGKDLDIKLSGSESTTVLKKAALEMAEHLRTYPGVTDIADDLPYGQEQLIFSLTPEGETLGFTVESVSRQIQAAFSSQLVQIFNEADDEIEVRVMLPDEQRHRMSSLAQLTLISDERISVPLTSVVRFNTQRGINVLRHTAGKLTVHVTAEVDAEATNSNTVINQMSESFIPSLQERYGLKVEFEGKAEEQRETFGDLQLGLVYAIGLIYIILAWVFGSYIWPLAIMAAIPFGLTGALIGHWVLNIDLTLLSMFGLFGLSGIVINDSIVLITFYKHLREAGLKPKRAIIEASCQRFRAVILTSLTTIAGLMPLMFETSLQAQFLIPMAVSISFGLFFGTALVLLVVPSMLSLIESLKARYIKRFGHDPVYDAHHLDTH